MRLAPADLVRALRELLGARLVAYLAAVSSTRVVNDWVEGRHEPPAGTVRRLRDAYYVAGLLSERESPVTIQSWFQGMNPQLDDMPPARLLRDRSDEAATGRVVAAARAFAAVG